MKKEKSNQIESNQINTIQVAVAVSTQQTILELNRTNGCDRDRRSSIQILTHLITVHNRSSELVTHLVKSEPFAPNNNIRLSDSTCLDFRKEITPTEQVGPTLSSHANHFLIVFCSVYWEVRSLVSYLW